MFLQVSKDAGNSSRQLNYRGSLPKYSDFVEEKNMAISYSVSMEKAKMLIEVLKGEAGASSSNFLQEYKAKILPETVNREDESKLILLTAADYLMTLVMEREPLSKEELQELPNKTWVWVEVLDDVAFSHPQQKSGWYRSVFAEMTEDVFACGYPGMTFGFDYKDMGTTWKVSLKGPL